MKFQIDPRRSAVAAGVALVLAAAAVVHAQSAAPVETQPVAGVPTGNAPAGEIPRREKSFVVTAQGKWTGKRLADGQPDVQGHWSNTISNHGNFTDPQGGDPVGGRPPTTARNERAPSRVSDPVDGEIPYQPWARAKADELRAGFKNPTRPEYIEPNARCWPGGPTKSLYWHGYEIRQYPGYVLFMFNAGTRIVYLNNPRHLPASIKLWNGDSRGHWEGNTLVVDTTNNNSKARFGRTGEFVSENATIQERFIFDNNGSRYTYQAVYTDPTVLTRPFTVTIPARRYTAVDKADGWNFEVNDTKFSDGGRHPHTVERDERICVENNGEFGNVAAPAEAGSAPR
ncbi:MAG: hypothetical protein QM718_07505 [Steroidobacteraceae bacterium]